jgi:hypothetical protein
MSSWTKAVVQFHCPPALLPPVTHLDEQPVETMLAQCAPLCKLEQPLAHVIPQVVEVGGDGVGTTPAPGWGHVNSVRGHDEQHTDQSSGGE